MLVLLSFGLVLVATVLLVLGLLSDSGLTLIWLSIASSLAAALVLVLALKLNKPRDEVRTTAPEPLPIPEPEPQPAPALATATAVASGSAASSNPEPDEWLAADQDTWSADDWSEGEEVEFPIADYDTLTSAQILPLLPQLYEDEIPVVEKRERATKARPEILQKLDEIRGSAGAVGEPEVASGEEVAPTMPELEHVEPAARSAAPEPATAVDPLASYTEPAATSWDDDWFPIEDYESLSAAQIRPLLPELDAEELEMVRAKELELGRRRSLLDEIDRLMPTSEPTVPAGATFAAPPVSEPAAVPAQPAVRTTTSRGTSTAGASPSSAAKKAASKKSPAKKASTKAAPAKKAASTSKSTTKPAARAKRSTANKTTAAPAKASAKKTTAKKTTAKTATSKAAATKATKKTTKKAAPAKTGAKKAAPAKKATRRPTER